MDHPYSTNSSYNSDEESGENAGHDSNLTTGPLEQDNNELLINCIRGYPNLWDKQHKLYKDSDARASSWADIAACLQKKVEDLQNSWNSLRKKFIKERLDIEKENLSGSAASSRTKWYLYDSMLFLEKIIQRRKTRTNLTPRLQLLPGKKGHTIDLTSPSASTLIERTPLGALQNKDNESSEFIPTITGPSTSSTNQNFPPTSPVLFSRPPRPASNSSTDSTDVELFVSAQSFKQPVMFKSAAKNKKNVSIQREEIIDKSIENVSSSITALSNHLIHGKTPIENDDDDVLIGRLVTNKLKKLSGQEKKETTKKIYDILLS